MKALTVTQPLGDSDRPGRQNASKHEVGAQNTVDRLAIHAGKNLPGWVAEFVRSEPEFTAVLGNLFDPRQRVLGDLPRGVILATCQLVAVKFIPLHDKGWDWIGPTGRRWHYPVTDRELAFGDFTAGRYAWLLGDVEPLENPIFARGSLGLWDATAYQEVQP
jgi:hypothetical protein